MNFKSACCWVSSSLAAIISFVEILNVQLQLTASGITETVAVLE